MVRVRHVENKKALEMIVDEYVTLGFRVQEMGERSAKVKKTQYGSFLQHLLVYIVGGLFTVGFGLIFPVFNVLLLLIKYYGGEEVVVKVEEEVV